MGIVVHVEQNLLPCPRVSVCPSYKENAQYVLETMAGFSQKHHVVLGTPISPL